eukprot:350725-Chlamydomonas_euryale.AAC.2
MRVCVRAFVPSAPLQAVAYEGQVHERLRGAIPAPTPRLCIWRVPGPLPLAPSLFVRLVLLLILLVPPQVQPRARAGRQRRQPLRQRHRLNRLGHAFGRRRAPYARQVIFYRGECADVARARRAHLHAAATAAAGVAARVRGPAVGICERRSRVTAPRTSADVSAGGSAPAGAARCQRAPPSRHTPERPPPAATAPAAAEKSRSAAGRSSTNCATGSSARWQAFSSSDHAALLPAVAAVSPGRWAL